MRIPTPMLPNPKTKQNRCSVKDIGAHLKEAPLNSTKEY